MGIDQFVGPDQESQRSSVGQNSQAADMKNDDARRSYILRLFVTGANLGSTQAIENLRAICKKHLSGSCELEVVDLYQHPGLAEEEGVFVTPTLIRKSPAPARRVVGDMTDDKKILHVLEDNENCLPVCEP